MTNLIIDDELAKRLEAIAEKLGLSSDEILHALGNMAPSIAILPDKAIIEVVTSHLPDKSIALLRAMSGMFDDDVPDLSTTVRETLHEYFRIGMNVLRAIYNVKP